MADDKSQKKKPHDIHYKPKISLGGFVKLDFDGRNKTADRFHRPVFVYAIYKRKIRYILIDRVERGNE